MADDETYMAFLKAANTAPAAPPADGTVQAGQKGRTGRRESLTQQASYTTRIGVPETVIRMQERLLEPADQLRYTSEADEAFEPFFIPAGRFKELRLPERAPESVNVFASLLGEEDGGSGMGEEGLAWDEREFGWLFEGQIGEGWKGLREVFKGMFGGREEAIRVWRLGRGSRVEVWVGGWVEGEGLVGLKTLSIES